MLNTYTLKVLTQSEKGTTELKTLEGISTNLSRVKAEEFANIAREQGYQVVVFNTESE